MSEITDRQELTELASDDQFLVRDTSAVRDKRIKQSSMASTDVQTQAGTSTTVFVTPASLAARTATESRAGIVELATSTETIAGDDTERAVTPAGFAAALPFVTPLQYGAAGDGTTNDSTAFTNAEAEDKLVFIPRTASGYNLTSTVSTTTAAWLIDPTLTWAQFSDSGQLDIRRGFYTGQGNGANIWRFADRVFVGESASENAGIFGAGGGGDSWFCHEFVAYTSGGTYEIVAGDTITGATSGATAKVVSLTLTSGTWAGGDAAGVLTVNRRTGTFQAENLNVGANTNVATIAGATAASYPSYLSRSAQLLVSAISPGVSLGGTTSIVGVGRTSDADNGVAIGVGSSVVNDKASGDAWGFIAEMQRESGSDFTTGLEVAAKNKGADTTMTPYARTSGMFGVWLAAGGDNTFGGSSANPSDTAVAIVKNSHTWNAGIVFEDDSLTGTDGVTGTGVAIHMARGHTIRWNYASGIGANIRSVVDAASSSTTMTFANTAFQLFDSQATSKRYFQARYVASGVNFVDVISSITTVGPTVSAQGDDSNIDLRLEGKGTGFLKSTDSITILDGTAIPAGGTAGAGFKFSSTSNFGVFFGSGAPSLAAGQGSLYLRSDGSSTSTRAYINTDGSTTWTAITTAA